MIRAYIITQIPGSPDVRDILQEVNVVLWEKRGTFKEGTNFGAWACTVARYKVLEHRRKEARHAGLFLFNDELSEFLGEKAQNCLLYTSPSPRDLSTSRMPSSA